MKKLLYLLSHYCPLKNSLSTKRNFVTHTYTSARKLSGESEKKLSFAIMGRKLYAPELMGSMAQSGDDDSFGDALRARFAEGLLSHITARSKEASFDDVLVKLRGRVECRDALRSQSTFLELSN